MKKEVNKILKAPWTLKEKRAVLFSVKTYDKNVCKIEKMLYNNGWKVKFYHIGNGFFNMYVSLGEQ